MDADFWNESYKLDAQQTAVEDFFLLQEAANLAPGSALDLGCGMGIIALQLAERDWQVTGVDWAEEAIRLARETAEARGLLAEFYVGDVTRWRSPEQYDLVYSTFALPEGEGRSQAAETMVNALKPGGTLIICEWDKRMAAVWGFSEEELPSPVELADLLPSLIIETAATRHVENAFTSDEKRGGENSEAYIAFIRARKK